MLGSSSTYITPDRPLPIWRRQPDALRLAARQRVGAAVQAQVGQADVVQEAQPRADLAHHLVGDLGLGAFERSASK
jgi:hypothetical protein